MSNVCGCPNPPGGTITCNDDQLAVCGYRNGQIVSGCFERPQYLRAIADDFARGLAVTNWVISTITGVERSDSSPIGPELIAMLRSGQFRNEQTGEVLHFTVPRDLRLERAAVLSA